jgi:hypothetical protein
MDLKLRRKGELPVEQIPDESKSKTSLPKVLSKKVILHRSESLFQISLFACTLLAIFVRLYSISNPAELMYCSLNLGKH